MKLSICASVKATWFRSAPGDVASCATTFWLKAPKVQNAASKCHAENCDEAVSGDVHEVSLEWMLIQRSVRKQNHVRCGEAFRTANNGQYGRHP